jgi:hypothetical protein
MNFKQGQPVWLENAAPSGNVLQFHQISTEAMADDLSTDLRVIAERIGNYKRDLAALERLRDTKAAQLDCCIRALGRQT